MKGGRLKSKLEQLGKLRKAAASSKPNVNSTNNNNNNNSDRWLPSPPRASELIPRPHPRFPALSDALGIRYERGRGRFVVAERDIDAGEAIWHINKFCRDKS